MDNNLGNIIKNAKARAAIYGGYVLTGIAIGAVQVGYPDPDPAWLTGAFNVWAYLAIPVGSLAAVNSSIVPTKVIEVETANVIQSETTNVAATPGDAG